MVFQWAGQVDEEQDPDKRGTPGDSVATAVEEEIVWLIQDLIYDVTEIWSLSMKDYTHLKATKPMCCSCFQGAKVPVS